MENGLVVVRGEGVGGVAEWEAGVADVSYYV